MISSSDFLQNLISIKDFFDEVREYHIKTGISISVVQPLTLTSGTTSIVTTSSPIIISTLQQNSGGARLINKKEQLLSECVVHLLNPLWENYIISNVSKNEKIYCKFFPKYCEDPKKFDGPATDYNRTFELRKLTAYLKHKNNNARQELATANEFKFGGEEEIILLYEDAEEYFKLLENYIKDIMMA